MTDARIPVALSIAGSDSSGGAGVQADLKTFTALGVYGATIITALTAQNTTGVQDVSVVDAGFVRRQIDSVMCDLRVCAVKTGMLATRDIVEAVADRWASNTAIPLVVDPVMISTSGHALIADGAVEAYRGALIPKAALLTPNLPEAGRLLGTTEAAGPDEAARQALQLRALGAAAVLVKGGHGKGPEIVDILCDAEGVREYRHPRITTTNTHGTGCTLSAAITAQLALGVPLRQAVADAIKFLGDALRSGAKLTVGAGHGPVDHLFKIRGPDA